MLRSVLSRALSIVCAFAVCAFAASSGRATETEHLGLSVLPAPGAVKVDGAPDDWDLTAGMLICGDVENQRDKLGVWVHAMYDAKNLYILARWLDATPLNNPGQAIGSYGFQGDCLQWRFITRPGTPQERGGHFTCWRDRDGKDLIFYERGVKFDAGAVKDAKSEGAQQGFQSESAQGYVQEIAMPWAQLTSDGRPLVAGDRLTLTFEPNFSIGANGRLSLKDLLQPGVTPDRVFTFMASNCWGPATLERKGKLPPRPVRLADGREFPTRHEKGVPVVDWTGLIQRAALAGFKPLEFEMPEDGYVSLQVVDSQGRVVRQLLSAAFFPKGKHQAPWDGLTTPNWKRPGEPVAPGSYAWRGIRHGGMGLRLVGWAHNAGSAPWDAGPTTNWGGDHGLPVAVDSAGATGFLGWSGAEAGKALVAADLGGGVRWKTSRHGMSGAELVAVDAGTVYVQNWNGHLFRVDATTGAFSSWEGTDSADLHIKDLWRDRKDRPQGSSDALEAAAGKLYIAFTQANLLAVVDAKTGRLLQTLDVRGPVDVEAAPGGKLLVLTASELLQVDPATDKRTPVVRDLKNASGLAVAADGTLFIGVRDPQNQVHVHDRSGKYLRSIGRAGGRRLRGPWQPDGLQFIRGMTVAADGNLWVMEADNSPKRVSVWDTKTGTLVRELFGPTAYGALGGAINPRDPQLMVGHGCEWRIDLKTGRAACLGVVHRDGMENSRFAVVKNRVYLVVASTWAFDQGPISVYQRLGDAEYKLRTRIYYADAAGNDLGKSGHGVEFKDAFTMVWADENADEKEQPHEVICRHKGAERLSGWYLNMSPDLTLYGRAGRYDVTGFTPCFAPKYDLNDPEKLPAVGMGSADNRLLLTTGEYGTEMGWMDAYDQASGQKLWSYPDNFVGVHGSHKAVPSQTGMVRGSFGPCGVAKLPPPLGNVWIIATNVGEWHLLNEDGFYITRLFQGDPLKVEWPAAATPGVSLDNAPPGMGGEDFGGSATLAENGKLYLQAGKTAFWNVEVTGLDTVRKLPGGQVDVSAADVRLAGDFRQRQLQAATGRQKLVVSRQKVNLTGDIVKDFAGSQIVSFKKQDSAAVRAAVAFDDQRLYLGFEVADETPWVNGATDVTQLYLGGDTVDLQLGADPAAAPDRSEAVAGDWRLSIGNFQGQPTAVIYRQASAVKKPRTFSSGVVKEFPVEFVDVLTDAEIKVAVKPKQGYVVEAAIPLAALGRSPGDGLRPQDGLELRGDLGVTHGGPDGQRTRLRTYWNNQSTGIVDDGVFELKLEPRNWGELRFKP